MGEFYSFLFFFFFRIKLYSYHLKYKFLKYYSSIMKKPKINLFVRYICHICQTKRELSPRENPFIVYKQFVTCMEIKSFENSIEMIMLVDTLASSLQNSFVYYMKKMYVSLTQNYLWSNVYYWFSFLYSTFVVISIDTYHVNSRTLKLTNFMLLCNI